MSVDIDSLKKDPRALNLFRSRLKMKKDGGEWVGLCAFHSESSPSFRVSLHDGVWVFKCFGCSCSGNVLQFVQKLDGVSYTTAIETVKSFYGGSWEENKQQVESVFKPLDVSETKEYVTYSLSDYRKYEDAFDSNSEAIAFLLDRGISYDSAKRLRLGFKQDGNKRTKQECPDIHDKGWLSMPRIEGDRVVGVKFRSIVKGRKEMWQMMGMKTTLFNTNTIDPLDDVFVVEGEMDCVIMEQAGFRSVSIPSGSTKITPEMKDKIMQANRVILAGDCDGKVGTAAMQKLWTDLQERTYLVIWPNECKDANETFLKESKANIEDFQNLVNLLVVKSVGSPIPNVSSMQEIMLSGDDPILIDHPERLRFPWKGVDEMAVLLPGSVLFLTATETGMGKALAHGTRVITPSGEKRIEDIRVGEVVYGSNGKTCTVTGVFPQGVKDAFRITFSDDTQITCCDEHLWKVDEHACLTKVIKTKDLFKKHNTRKRGYRYFVRMTEPVEFPEANEELPLDPYLLGVLLGDGNYTKKVVQVTNPQVEIMEEVSRIVAKMGMQVSTSSYNPIQHQLTRGKRGTGNGVNPIKKILIDLGLFGCKSHEKFIPECYKRASVEQRIALVQGLMDTDGAAKQNNGAQFWTTSQKLKDDFSFVVQSLGGRVNFKENVRTGKRSGYYTTIKLNRNFSLFRFHKNRSRYRSDSLFSTKRGIKKVELVGSSEMTCITVDSADHCFLLENFIVTHNSTFAEQFTMYGARKHNEVVVCYSSELTPFELSTIAAAQILGKDRREISGEDRKEAAHQLNGVQYYVGHDPAIQTIGAALDLLEAAIRRLGGTLAVLDNFHHLCRNEEKEIKVQENSSQRIKRMAGQLRCKMVVLGAPRKSDKSGVGKRLALADIRGAQALQDDADAVFFMHRKRTPGQELEFEPITEIQRQKARSCGTGNAFTRLYFHGAKATFTELETQQEGI